MLGRMLALLARDEEFITMGKRTSDLKNSLNLRGFKNAEDSEHNDALVLFLFTLQIF